MFKIGVVKVNVLEILKAIELVLESLAIGQAVFDVCIYTYIYIYIKHMYVYGFRIVNLILEVRMVGMLECSNVQTDPTVKERAEGGGARVYTSLHITHCFTIPNVCGDLRRHGTLYIHQYMRIVYDHPVKHCLPQIQGGLECEIRDVCVYMYLLC